MSSTSCDDLNSDTSEIDSICSQIEIEDFSIEYITDEYDHLNDQKGLLVIFNFRNFNTKQEEDKDVKRLEGCFKNIPDFDVESKRYNLQKKDFARELRTLASEDFSKRSCLIVIILSQGGWEGNLFSPDGDYMTSQELWKYFSSTKCPSLSGKPKIFIMQSCKHLVKSKFLTEKKSYEPNFQKTYILPKENDILLAYSTVEGNMYYRTKSKGSWYIQELCNNIEKYYHQEDFTNILTKTSNSIQQVMVAQKSKYIYRQMPCLLSSLTKKFYLTKERERIISEFDEKCNPMIDGIEEIKNMLIKTNNILEEQEQRIAMIEGRLKEEFDKKQVVDKIDGNVGSKNMAEAEEIEADQNDVTLQGEVRGIEVRKRTLGNRFQEQEERITNKTSHNGIATGIPTNSSNNKKFNLFLLIVLILAIIIIVTYCAVYKQDEIVDFYNSIINKSKET